MALYDYGRGLWIREHGDFWLFEYMPVEALPVRAEWFVSAGAAEPVEPPLAVEIVPGTQTPLRRQFTVNSAQPWTLQLHQFFFPGWQAVVDGETVAAQPVGELALAGVPLAAGQHSVEFRFGATPVRQLGTLVSLAGLIALLAGHRLAAQVVVAGGWRSADRRAGRRADAARAGCSRRSDAAAGRGQLRPAGAARRLPPGGPATGRRQRGHADLAGAQPAAHRLQSFPAPGRSERGVYGRSTTASRATSSRRRPAGSAARSSTTATS